MSPLFAFCILFVWESFAVQLNIDVTLPIRNITIFDESEIWGINYLNKTENLLTVNVVIEKKRMNKLFTTYTDTIISYQVIYDNVEKVIEEQRIRINNTEKWDASKLPDLFFQDYRSYSEYLALIELIVLTHPIITTRSIMGSTVEGRSIEMITLRGNGEGQKPGLYIQAAVHAREWLANMATMYILNSLVDGYGNDEAITEVLDNVNIFIAPTVNIDGYMFSWTNNRMWRKNRRNNGGGSYGVDLNRNWGPTSTWCTSGSSTNPNSDTYCGPSAFSEPEIAAARDFINDPANNIKAAIDMHTFGELLLWPWQYTYDPLPPIYYEQFQELGQSLSDSIFAVHGVRYNSIQGSDLYPHSGGMIDYVWSHNNAQIIGFTYEGRGPGFDASNENIIPAGQEQLASIITLAQTLY